MTRARVLRLREDDQTADACRERQQGPYHLDRQPFHIAPEHPECAIKNPIYAFDTFTGFPVGSTDTFLGQPASGPQFANYREAVVANITEAVGSLDGVTLVEGPVEDTIPKTDVGPIAMLRLDTDHYDSTKVELDHYWPKLVPHGVVIVDDYGCYEGSRRATDEYFATLPIRPMLNRIDGGVFSGIKPGQGSCLFRRRLLDKILEVCLCRLGQLPPEGTPYMRRTASIAPVST